MKKLLLLLAITFSTASYSQTAITDANFQDAINECLSTNPEDGLCSDSEYGSMPDWDVSNVTDMQQAFLNKEDFNADISGWDVSNVETMSLMFKSAIAFNQDITGWNTVNVTNMLGMFYKASDFNQPIGIWNVNNVTDMESMFRDAELFNQPINNWNVTNVESMSLMFKGALLFNQDLSGWNVSKVTKMETMFGGNSPFNQDIGDWDVSSLTLMGGMFGNNSSFNQDLSGWDVSNVESMASLFDGASSFNQNLSQWNIIQLNSAPFIFRNSGLSTNNYDAILNSWSQQNVQSDVSLGAEGIAYCNGADARLILINTYGWNITDSGLLCTPASVDDQNQLDISIYPNPTSDIVYVEGNYTQLKVIIYNVLGKEILNKSITNSIDISHLDNGVYILQLSDGVKLSTRKIIKN
ncbi:BspA family leucine-rich repeat surface protein [Flavobacteriaceae bacterium]|nr:BspA family leucine-rich repeat surface protein [Flavobacteriaceae bacterium]